MPSISETKPTAASRQGKPPPTPKPKPHPSPSPEKEIETPDRDANENRDSGDRRDRRGFPGVCPVAEVEAFLSEYIVVPESSRLVIAVWIAAAWLAAKWDRFPHLAITSPEKRCGKTRTLQLISLLSPNAVNTTNISPAAVYRLIELKKPTLLLDEAQSISRRGSESSEIIRELLNAGIDRNAKVLRVGGEKNDQVVEFSVYSPKVIALIGELDGVLADRCLPVGMRRKTETDPDVLPYRSRVVEPKGEALRAKLDAWAVENAERLAAVYDLLEPFDIRNDRMAELLLPLQAVLSDLPDRLGELKEYANELDAKDRDAERMSDGVRLLTACREVFDKGDREFFYTVGLVCELISRVEEPWGVYDHGKPITPETLAKLLRPYGIRSERDKKQTGRGYYKFNFREAWERYLPPPPAKTTSSPSTPANSALSPQPATGGLAARLKAKGGAK